MINTLDRYIAKHIIFATGVVALIITGVLFLMLSLGELKAIGVGDYSLDQVFIYVLLRLPTYLYEFSPLLVLLGSIVGLSSLSSTRELSMMRASGFSIPRIFFSVFCAALFLILLIAVIGEGFAPGLSYDAELRKENLRHGGEAVITSRGVWYHVDNNFIHIQHAVNRQLIENIVRYQFNDHHQLQASYFAKSMAYKNNRWRVKEVVKTTLHNDHTETEHFPNEIWDLKLNPSLLKMSLVDPSEMSLTKLLKFARYLQQNGTQAGQYQYNFWQRAFQPLASLIMVFLAIPFVLSALPAATMGWRIIAGVMIGFAFFLCNSFLGQLSIVFQLPAIIAAMLPILLFAILGIFLSRQLIKR